MADIIPAVIPKSLAHLADTLARVGSFARTVQIDVVDGNFVPHTSWPYGTGDMAGTPADIASLTSGIDIELDLMIAEPERHIDAWVSAGAKRVVVHIESTNAIEAIIAHRNAHEYQIGIALNNDTPLSAIEPYLSSVDFVQCMGIAEIGAQGAPFDGRVIARVRELKAAYPAMPVSVDGSMNETTIPLVAEAGAERFVVGSAILTAIEPSEMYARLLRLVS